MFSYTYISLLGRYNVTCSPESVEKRLLLPLLVSRIDCCEFNKRFMEPWFGVIAGGTVGPLQIKEEVAFVDFNPHSNAPKRPQLSNLNAECRVQK